MGTALAITAWLRGAEVYVVAGPNSQYLPEDMRMHVFPVTSADDMYEKCHELWLAMDYGIFKMTQAFTNPKNLKKKITAMVLTSISVLIGIF